MNTKIKKIATLRKFGRALIRMFTCFLMLGIALTPLRGLRTLTVRSILKFFEAAELLKDISMILKC